MPLFMDIHKNVRDTTPEDVAAAHEADLATQAAYGVKYLRWWFNRDLGSIYCLVDAPSAQAANDVHKLAHGLVADEIIEVQSGDFSELMGPDEYGPALREDPVERPPSTDNAFRTIVFTDLQDSTSMTQRLGDEQAFVLMRKHDELMDGCLQTHNGWRVKHTGDGLMAAFGSVARAVDCMVAMQRALVRHSEAQPDVALRARMGAAAGEPVSHNDDLFGATVQLAARLCSDANGGQIIVASVVRDLCMGKRFDFGALGDVQMKGFEEPVRIFEVRW